MGEYRTGGYEAETNSEELVRVGSFVELQFSDGEILYVRLYEERPLEGEVDGRYEAISIGSPIGKAIISHSVGDQISYRTPSGATLMFEINSISEN